MSKEDILILGAGSWGVTLANLLAEKRYKVSLWEFNPDMAKHLNNHRTLPVLPSHKIFPDIEIDFNMENI